MSDLHLSLANVQLCPRVDWLISVIHTQGTLYTIEHSIQWTAKQTRKNKINK